MAPTDTLTMTLSKTLLKKRLRAIKSAGACWTDVPADAPAGRLRLFCAVPRWATSLQTLPGFNLRLIIFALIVLRLAVKLESFHL